ncbi:amidohydrolase [Nocardia sp. CA2R105]|uniref:amidohydrolase family protein n=1 Tax=Nocardia coffeae TaxID=2873381 RepID=UPI001CA6C0C5|nr:amidohydrolase family protein [Nocardia coffeae]MBY8864033.1 amidohydrolase [Nocardia coffeae]
MIEEPWGLSTRDYNGVDNILWECDYPHCDSPWPNTQAACKELFDDLDPEITRKITHANAEQLFNFPLSQDLITQYTTQQNSAVRTRYEARRIRLRQATLDKHMSVATPGNGASWRY